MTQKTFLWKDTLIMKFMVKFSALLPTKKRQNHAKTHRIKKNVCEEMERTIGDSILQQ